MNNLTARHFALLYLEEMAEETGFTFREIQQQLPMATKIVGQLLNEDPEMDEADMACEFVQRYMVAF